MGILSTFLGHGLSEQGVISRSSRGFDARGLRNLFTSMNRLVNN